MTLPRPSKPAGFNGATADQPWRAEVRRRDAEDCAVASMGPRLISRGEASLARGYTTLEKSFNGATADQPWRAHHRY